ncbi:MAG TPA: hypothetical protein VHL77_02225 [Ferruginibacter sp.]|nr:hypothetical protein [Ferruginibacter sp.]
MKESFIYDFKITYFKKLLLAGYNNSAAVNSLIKSDHSGFAEIILSPGDYHLLDSIVHRDNVLMVKDSIDGYNRAEGAQGKRILKYALDKYQSSWLDSLAKDRAKIFMRNARAD